MTPGIGRGENDVLAFQISQGALPLTFFPGSHEVGDDTVDHVSVHLQQGLGGGRQEVKKALKE